MVFSITFWGACFWLPGVPAYAEKIPALAEVPADFPGKTQARLNQRRQKLDREYYEFKEAADAFSAKPAKEQSDAEYEALEAWRNRYIDKVKTFNRDILAYGGVEGVIKKSPTAFIVGIKARGEVSFETADGRKFGGPLLEGALIDTGTRVTTGSDGHLRMLLPDETVFTIGPNSDMVIDDFVYDPASTSTLRKIAVNITKGLFRFVTGKAARKDPAKMKVTLPVGGTGFCGTEAEIKVAPDGSGYVKLFSGEMEITPKKTGIQFVVNAKHMVTFKADGTFSPPEPINNHGGMGEEQMPAS
jgi:hypothetical protein